MTDNATLGRFGHHPEPAIDFCIEVEVLQGIARSAHLGLTGNGHEADYASYTDRHHKAMAFHVGADEGAVRAKALLRELPQRLPFLREWRYHVIKRKHLTPKQETALLAFLEANGIRQVDGVTVEADWPEYEPVWQMIEARCTA